MNRLLTKVRSNLFFRTMFTSLFGRTDYSKEPGRFKPYFQYRIELLKETDEYLYFDKEPYPIQYYNEIFNKINAYSEGHIAYLLDFHFNAYDDKEDFLTFFEFQSEERLKRKSGYSIRLQSILKWVEAKKGKLNGRVAVESGPATEALERIQDDLAITRIVIHDSQHHLFRFVQLFLVMKDLEISVEGSRSKTKLLQKCTDGAIASLLRVHIEPYNEKKLSTLQKEVWTIRNDMKTNSPKYEKLAQALQEFFKD